MGGIFISYRREDSGPWAGRIRDRLSQHFGAHQVFRDIDTIGPGARFPHIVEQAIGSCDALLAVIGPNWLSASEGRRRRLDDPSDLVRQEIAIALRRQDVLVVPVLIGQVPMPAATSLPADLAPLAECNAVRITDEGWDDQMVRLIRALDAVVNDARDAPEVSASVGANEDAQEAVSRTQSIAAQRSRRRVVAATVGALAAIALAAAGLFWFTRSTCSGSSCEATATERGLEKSIVLLEFSWSGVIHIPPQADPAGKGFWTEKLTSQAICTGWYVSKTAQIVTTAHCVDPAQADEEIVHVYERNHPDANLESEIDTDWVAGSTEEAELNRRVLASQPSAIEGATLVTPMPAEVVDFKVSDDLALLQVPNMSIETPGLVVAQNSPQVGDSVRSIGFNLAASDTAAIRQIAPSVKPGQVSSVNQKVDGMSVVETNTAIMRGMAGGPTVNADDQVLGVNSRALESPGVPNAYITNIAELRSFLQVHNVDLVEPTASDGRSSRSYVYGAAALVLAVSAALFIARRRNLPRLG